MANRNLINFISKYLSKNNHTEFLNEITSLLRKTKKNKKKIFIFGNGGSASIADHFCLDLVNKYKVEAFTYNSTSLITCFANDYEYKNSIVEFLKIFLKTDDIVFLISSSGNSLNMVNAAKFIKDNNVITLTGFSKGNKLKKYGDFNLWIDCKNYNAIENLHQIYLLQIIENLIND